MPRFARLFDSAEDIVDAFREAMKLRDADGALRLWLDEDSVTCVMPDGQRLIGHENLRQAFAQLLEEQPVLIDAIETSSHASLASRVAISSSASPKPTRPLRENTAKNVPCATSTLFCASCAACAT